MKIPADVITALTTRAHTDSHRLTLTGPRMDPKLYQRIDEVLQGAGGRWDRGAQAHVFPIDAAAALAALLAAGEVVTPREKRQSAQYFPTPAAVVARLLELADVRPGMEALEPSAGSGAIAAALAARGLAVDCIERDPGYAAALAEAGVARTLHIADFLTVPAEPRYDRVVMNPPFTQGADIRHVEHALRFLRPGGLLVSVMSWTVTEQNRRTAAFRQLVEARGGTVEAVDTGAFRESGTDIPTVIVTIPATRPADAKPTTWPTRKTGTDPDLKCGDPAQIVDEIRASLRQALAAFDAVAESLAKPRGRPASADVAELPAPHEEQLSFDGLSKAS
ncbi:methyltransferase [Streptomyces bottropensis]|uniref:methyltransferase n=1 Tax=Streptomyces bottropensis TaxID=42235 RepID=UPI00368E7B4D